MEDEWMTLARNEDAAWWFDKETGDLVGISGTDWEQALQSGAAATGELQSPDLALMRQIQAQPERYQQVPLSPEQEIADARAFVPTVLSSLVQRKLDGVLVGPRAMGRFRSMLARHPEELARWQSFRAGRLRTRIQEWLHEAGLRRA